MKNSLKITEQIHERALEVSARYKRAEADLIEILQQVEQHRVFVERGYSSLFQYVVKELGLSESVTYNLISVARKAREVPELKAELQKGTITLSNARKIAPVLTMENRAEWLQKASDLSQRQLEKEIVRVRPQTATPERATYVTPTRVSLNLGLSEKSMLELRRVQDLVSQSKRRPVSLEEVVEELSREYLERHDPAEKAKRHVVKKGFPTESVKTPVARQVRKDRTPIPATILHRVNFRDQRRCTFTNSRGEKCNQTRWIEIHHKTPVSKGGTNDLENLVTLCSVHHDWVHRQD